MPSEYSKNRRRKKKTTDEFIKDLIRKKENAPKNLMKKDFGFKGIGVVTQTSIEANDYIAYYDGQQHFSDPSWDDTYLFEILQGSKRSWIDGAPSTGIAKFFNDSHRSPNMRVKVITVDNYPVPVFYASRDILPGEELTYNYGDGDYFWRKRGWQPDTPSGKKKGFSSPGREISNDPSLPRAAATASQAVTRVSTSTTSATGTDVGSVARTAGEDSCPLYPTTPDNCRPQTQPRRYFLRQHASSSSPSAACRGVEKGCVVNKESPYPAHESSDPPQLSSYSVDDNAKFGNISEDHDWGEGFHHGHNGDTAGLSLNTHSTLKSEQQCVIDITVPDHSPDSLNMVLTTCCSFTSQSPHKPSNYSQCHESSINLTQCHTSLPITCPFASSTPLQSTPSRKFAYHQPCNPLPSSPQPCQAYSPHAVGFQLSSPLDSFPLHSSQQVGIPLHSSHSSPQQLSSPPLPFHAKPSSKHCPQPSPFQDIFPQRSSPQKYSPKPSSQPPYSPKPTSHQHSFLQPPSHQLTSSLPFPLQFSPVPSNNSLLDSTASVTLPLSTLNRLSLSVNSTPSSLFLHPFSKASTIPTFSPTPFNYSDTKTRPGPNCHSPTQKLDILTGGEGVSDGKSNGHQNQMHHSGGLGRAASASSPTAWLWLNHSGSGVAGSGLSATPPRPGVALQHSIPFGMLAKPNIIRPERSSNSTSPRMMQRVLSSSECISESGLYQRSLSENGDLCGEQHQQQRLSDWYLSSLEQAGSVVPVTNTINAMDGGTTMTFSAVTPFTGSNSNRPREQEDGLMPRFNNDPMHQKTGACELVQQTNVNTSLLAGHYFASTTDKGQVEVKDMEESVASVIANVGMVHESYVYTTTLAARPVDTHANKEDAWEVEKGEPGAWQPVNTAHPQTEAAGYQMYQLVPLIPAPASAAEQVVPMIEQEEDLAVSNRELSIVNGSKASLKPLGPFDNTGHPNTLTVEQQSGAGMEALPSRESFDARDDTASTGDVDVDDDVFITSSGFLGSQERRSQSLGALLGKDEPISPQMGKVADHSCRRMYVSQIFNRRYRKLFKSRKNDNFRISKMEESLHGLAPEEKHENRYQNSSISLTRDLSVMPLTPGGLLTPGGTKSDASNVHHNWEGHNWSTPSIPNTAAVPESDRVEPNGRGPPLIGSPFQKYPLQYVNCRGDFEIADCSMVICEDEAGQQSKPSDGASSDVNLTCDEHVNTTAVALQLHQSSQSMGDVVTRHSAKIIEDCSSVSSSAPTASVVVTISHNHDKNSSGVPKPWVDYVTAGYITGQYTQRSTSLPASSKLLLREQQPHDASAAASGVSGRSSQNMNADISYKTDPIKGRDCSASSLQQMLIKAPMRTTGATANHRLPQSITDSENRNAAPAQSTPDTGFSSEDVAEKTPKFILAPTTVQLSQVPRQKQHPVKQVTSTDHSVELSSPLPLRAAPSAMVEELIILENEEVKQVTSGSQLYKRPRPKPIRPCPFCENRVVQLKRHIVNVHKDQIGQYQEMSGDGQKIFFESLKRKGIDKANQKLALEGKSTSEFLREKRSSGKNADNLMHCMECLAFLSRKSYKKHMCARNTNVFSRACNLGVASKETPEFLNVMEGLRGDEIGNFIRTKKGETIMNIGKDFYRKYSTTSKKEEGAKRTRTHMRLTATLFLAFERYANEDGKPVTVLDMFNVQNVKLLEDAMNSLTEENSNTMVKAYGNAIRTSCELLACHFLASNDETGLKTVDNFRRYFNRAWAGKFRHAEEIIHRRRIEVNRNPVNLVQKEDVSKIINYCKQELFKSTLKFDRCAFMHIRNVLMAQLTVSNGRRGGEVERLTIEDAEKGFANTWINTMEIKETMTEKQAEVIKKNYIFYVISKITKDPVSIVMSREYAVYLRYLTTPSVRKAAGIPTGNPYAFPSTTSDKKANGYQALLSVCKDSYVTTTINATNIRHRVTSSMKDKLTSRERQTLMKHMGHSSSVHENIYQSLPAADSILLADKMRKEVTRLANSDSESSSETENISCDSQAVEEIPGKEPVKKKRPLQVENIQPVSEEEVRKNWSQGNNRKKIRGNMNEKNSKPSNASYPSSSEHQASTTESSTSVASKSRFVKKKNSFPYFSDDDSNNNPSESSGSVSVERIYKNHQRQSRMRSEKHKWLSEETECMSQFFAEFIGNKATNTRPTNLQVGKLITEEKFESLKNLSTPMKIRITRRKIYNMKTNAEIRSKRKLTFAIAQSDQ